MPYSNINYLRERSESCVNQGDTLKAVFKGSPCSPCDKTLVRTYRATGYRRFRPSVRMASPTALTTLRISLLSMAPMQPTRNVSICVSLPG